VTKVAIVCSWLLAFSLWLEPTPSIAKSQELKAKGGFLAGPLGFEPRQSAPKALDLPLVDGPVMQFQVSGFQFPANPARNWIPIVWRSSIKQPETRNWKLETFASTETASASPSPAPPTPASAAWPSLAPPPSAMRTNHTTSTRSPTTTHISRPRSRARVYLHSARDIQERRLVRSRFQSQPGQAREADSRPGPLFL